MYIGEVIRRADKYYPSEYDTSEMYAWCDEVSSMLLIEDKNIFIREQFLTDSDGKLVLPERVEFENIVSVSIDGKEIKKSDARNPIYFPERTSCVEITYLKPYSPIRVVSYDGEVEINKTESSLILGDNCFIKGDFLRMTLGDISAAFEVIENEFDGGKYILKVTNDVLSEMPDTGNAVIERVVTDKTVCDAPYDTMYIDYIIAKTGLLQHDFETYNQFMTAFNSRLRAYKKWIVNQLPQAGGRLENWW